MWYVVQVKTGCEETTRDLVMQALGDTALIKECFVPRYVTSEQRAGKWLPVNKVLFPGYLIIDTMHIADVKDVLVKIRAFTRLLGANNETFTPLSAAEVAWVNAFTQKGQRTVEMSTAVVEGDRVVVIDGPLVSREALIRKINHRKKLAYLQVEMFGRTVDVQVGLRVLRKKKNPRSSGETC